MWLSQSYWWSCGFIWVWSKKLFLWQCLQGPVPSPKLSCSLVGREGGPWVTPLFYCISHQINFFPVLHHFDHCIVQLKALVLLDQTPEAALTISSLLGVVKVSE